MGVTYGSLPVGSYWNSDSKNVITTRKLERIYNLVSRCRIIQICHDQFYVWFESKRLVHFQSSKNQMVTFINCLVIIPGNIS